VALLRRAAKARSQNGVGAPQAPALAWSAGASGIVMRGGPCAKQSENCPRIFP
jgi:hypothetical protein